MDKAKAVRWFLNFRKHWSCVFRGMQGLQFIWKAHASFLICSNMSMSIYVYAADCNVAL